MQAAQTSPVAPVAPPPGLPQPALAPEGPLVSPITGLATIEVPGIGTIAVPQTCSEIDRIEDARSSISDQISSARGRREDVEERLREAFSGGDRAGLEAQLGTLDARIVQLEKELALTGAQLTHAPAQLACSTVAADFPQIPPIDRIPQAAFIAVPIVFTIFVLGPIAAAISRAIWRRTTRDRTDLPAWSETADRLQRLETAVDAIAIEIERVSEGQRFVTKVLAESRSPVGVAARSSDSST